MYQPAAVLGNTKMRIRTEYYGNTLNSGSACTAFTYGETVDYVINIATPIPCTGTPPATTVSASVSSACAGTNFSLSATGVPAGTTGILYEWQYSVGGGPFTDLPGGTTNPFSTAMLQGG